jgi:hypothetical protein
MAFVKRAGLRLGHPMSEDIESCRPIPVGMRMNDGTIQGYGRPTTVQPVLALLSDKTPSRAPESSHDMHPIRRRHRPIVIVQNIHDGRCWDVWNQSYPCANLNDYYNDFESASSSKSRYFDSYSYLAPRERRTRGPTATWKHPPHCQAEAPLDAMSHSMEHTLNMQIILHLKFRRDHIHLRLRSHGNCGLVATLTMYILLFVQIPEVNVDLHSLVDGNLYVVLRRDFGMTIFKQILVT